MRKLLLAITLTGIVVVNSSLTFAQDRFTDIANHWAASSINKLADSDLFKRDDGKFLPDQEITRSEFVVLLHKALGIKIAYFKAPDIGEYYSDVRNEDPYASPLYDLVTTNIIDYKDQFKPDSMLPREEIVHYIMNAYKYKMGEDYRMIKIAHKPFADEEKINVLYNGEIAMAEHMGIIVRPESNEFFPDDNSTRAQAAALIDRLLTQLEKENQEVKVTTSAVVTEGTLEMKLTIVNNLETKTVIHHTSGQKFDFKVLDADRNILYTWSADKMFSMALEDVTIEPGKAVEYTAEIEKDKMESFNGKAVYVKGYIAGKSDGFVINPDGYEAKIQ